MQLIEQTIMCPYCGEDIDILIDDSAGNQDYFEDCSVCCRPIRIRLDTDNSGNVQFEIRRDDD